VSQENVDLAYEARAAYDRGGVEAMLHYFDPDVELVAPPQWPDDRIGRGHDGVKQVFAAWAAQFDDFTFDPPERIIDAGADRVVVLLNQRGRIKGSQAELEQPVGLVLDAREGKAIRWRAYLSWEEALSSAGREE
jgi:ketosteroid isomerase-like protein